MGETSLPLSEEPHVTFVHASGQGRVEAASRLWAEVDTARAAAEALVSSVAPAPSVLWRLAEIYFRLGEIETAKEHFEAALRADAGLAGALAGLARCADALDKPEEAQHHLRRARELLPSDAALGFLSERIGSLQSASARAALGASGRFADGFKFANELMDRRRFHEAEQLYRQLLAVRPRSPALLYKLGSALVELGRLDEAGEWYDRAIDADPGFVWAYVGRADLREANGALAGALRDLETAAKLKPDLRFLPTRLRGIRRQIEGQAGRDAPAIVTWPANGSSATRSSSRIVVVAWDLSHNAVGRAWALAEIAARRSFCELVGPVFPAYGDDLWAPLRAAERKVAIHGFHASCFADFMNGAIRLVREHPCEIAYVSKPRFSSLLIGFLYKTLHGARLVLDIDDDELAFVGAVDGMGIDEFVDRPDPSDWQAPHGKRWTQLANSMIEAADAVTVCNAVLQKRHGGTIIRHARDEDAFDSPAAARATLRAEFGFGDDDKVVLFLGTPRRHKGVLEIASALRALGDPRAVFCIIGTIADESLRRDLAAMSPVRIVLHPDQPFDRLASLNAMADVVCILQDPDSRISLSQTPAKLTDALATGTPVIATALEPIMDLADQGKIALLDPSSSREALVDLLRDALAGAFDDASARRRQFFRDELSTAANARKLEEVFREAVSRPARPLPDDLTKLLTHIGREMPGYMDEGWRATRLLDERPGVGPLMRLDRNLNVVVFWKQNDTGLYGRRPDMLVQELSRLPGVGRILQIDAPVCVDQLLELTNEGTGGSPSRLIASQIIRRFLRADDSGGIHRRTFVYRGDETRLLGRDLPPEAAFANAVERWLDELGMRENVLAWVCPVIPAFPEIQARLRFPFVFCDVIDDQRQWPMPALRRARISRLYRETFALTDAATANSGSIAGWLRQEGLPVRLVPNGMEIFPDVAAWPMPAELLGLGRPIVGYSGSLTHRIDWKLIQSISQAHPDWSIVLIGAAPDIEIAQATLALPNVHHLGVVPYDRAIRCIAHFDVAIVPHLRTALSEGMNPLKIYVYRSLGIPVVSTPVPNIGDFEGDIVSAAPSDFVASIEAVLACHQGGRQLPPASVLERFAWSARLRDILDHIQQQIDARRDATTGVAGP